MTKYIFGFHSIEAALNNPENIDHVLISNNRHDRRLDTLLEQIKNRGITFKYVDNLDKLTNTDKHQGVAAIIKTKTTNLDFKQLLKNLDNKEDGIILILDGITDVHNFGAIIRSADCFGVVAIITPKNNSANIDNPLVAKASSGAVNTTPVVMVNNLSQAIEQLKDHDFWIAGTALSPNAINLFEFKCNKKIAWVLGSEGSGMRRLVSESCDYLVTIPMQGTTQSLNVSVAAGVILAYTRFSAKHNIQT